MTPVFQPKHPALRAVYWREEIVEVVMWLRGEGFAAAVDTGVLERFLGLGRDEAGAQLERLTAQGYLERLGDGRFALSAAGEAEARRVVEAARVVGDPAPGRCGPECWCGTSPIEAAACADRQVQ